MTLLRIRVFGGLSVENHGSPLGPASQQPKRLALLALLACSGSQGATRDRLIGYLWPESDDARARNALSQALFGLRRDLLDDSIIEGREILRLNPALVSSDVGDFATLLASGQLDAAVDLYRGPLLLGVHLREGTQFDEWLEAERATQDRRYRDALQALVDRARNQGDTLALLRRAQQLADADPYDAGAVRQLSDALLRARDRPAATRALQTYCARVRTELELEPDPSILARLDSLLRPDAVASGRDTGSAGITPAPVPPESPTSAPRQSRRIRTATALLAGGAALTGALVAVMSLRRHPTAAPDPATDVVVLPFAVPGDSSLDYLREGMARLVAHGMDGTGSLRAGIGIGLDLGMAVRTPADSATALKQHRELDRYVAGLVTTLGERIEVRAELHDANQRGRLLGIATAGGQRDSVFPIAETLIRRLLGFEPEAGAGGLIGSAAENTASLPAFRAFVEAERLFRASRFADAIASYRKAIGFDSSFALAWYRLSEAYDWNGQSGPIAGAAATALRLGDRLPWRERALLEGALAWRKGFYEEAEFKYRYSTAADPNQVEAWFQYGEVLFHNNANRGRSFLEAKTPFERVLRLDPYNRGALTHLGRIYAFQGDRVRADSVLRAAEALMPPESEVLLFHAAVLGDAARLDSAMARFATEQIGTVITSVMRLASYAREFALGDTLLQRALERRTGRTDLVSLDTWAAILAVAQGQRSRALRELDALSEVHPAGALRMRGVVVTLPYFGASSRELMTTREQLRTSGALPVVDTTGPARFKDVERLYLSGLLAARLGERDGLVALIDTLDRASQAANADSAQARFLGTRLRALRDGEQGHWTEALRELASLPELSQEADFYPEQLVERYLRATALERLERFDEALGVYGSLIMGNPGSLILAAPAALQRARLLTRLRRYGEARLDYQTVLRLWASADAGLAPVLDSVRREAAALPR